MTKFFALLLLFLLLFGCSKSNPEYYVVSSSTGRTIASDDLTHDCVELLTKVGLPSEEELSALKAYRSAFEKELKLDQNLNFRDPLESVQRTPIDEIRNRWRDYAPMVYWNDWIDSINSNRLVELYQLTDKKNIQVTTELYGSDVYNAWKKGDEFLSSISKGSFTVTKDLIEQLSKIVVSP